MQSLCSQLGITRQAYYKRNKVVCRRFLVESDILKRVKAIRKELPETGGRKLQEMLAEQGVQIGRDRLFNLLRNNRLLLRKKKKHVRTTNSYHRFRMYKNKIKDLTVYRPNQVFVSDITYLRTRQDFCYLALVTDLYSRKIVGYDVSRSLAVEGAQRALKMALENVREPDKLIHHSDRGIQYCCYAYTDMLKDRDIEISMTEENHCYENAVAERLNGILKREFMLGETLKSFNFAKELVKETVKLYNEKRLHLSLNYQTPESRYRLAA
jgi:transposase InsO family protein